MRTKHKLHFLIVMTIMITSACQLQAQKVNDKTSKNEYEKVNILIFDIDKDDILDTVAVHKKEEFNEEYFYYIECKTSKMKFKSLRTQAFNIAYMHSVELKSGWSNFSFGLNLSGVSNLPEVVLTFSYDNEVNDFYLTEINLEDQINEQNEGAFREINATLEDGKWTARTYIIELDEDDYEDREKYIAKDFYNKDEDKYYTIRKGEDSGYYLQSHIFMPPKKRIPLNSFSIETFYELFSRVR